MNILIIGSGGREHALAWAVAKSPLVDEVFCAPGNPGMDAIGPCFDVDITDVMAVQTLALQLEPDLIIIGPEQPLAAGVSDALRARGYDVFGPSQSAARLESSKEFSKKLMQTYDIPTAAFGVFGGHEAHLAKAFLTNFSPPYVLKADGLAAGKGVVIAPDLAEAEAEIDAMLGGKFGEASSRLVIEAFMEGEEASLFVITDGEGYICLPAAQDHKRVGEGDTGPNTGGMGAYAPAPCLTDALLARCKTEIVEPTLAAMRAEDAPFSGVLYVGLMLTETGPQVVEYNARFGDPECQPLLLGLEGDIVPVLLAAATGTIKGCEQAYIDLLKLDQFKPSVGVVMATKGYPGRYEKNSIIAGDTAPDTPDLQVFQAGTGMDDAGNLLAIGGRVLCVSARGKDLDEAFERAYAGVDAIDWPEGFCRRDIGWRVRSKPS